jgi:carbamoyl-phosphate synthase large subunit
MAVRVKAVGVLIDSSGTVTCQSVMKGLRHQTEIPVEIVGADSSPRNAGRYLADRWVEVPRVDDAGYFEALLELVRELRIQLFVPIFDTQFPALAERRGEFEALGCAVAVSPSEAVLIANEKDRTAAFFGANGFSSPRLVSPEEARAGQCRFPLILKPRGGRSSIGVEMLRLPEEVDLFLARADEEVVLQEAVEGREFTADILCALDGEPIAVVPRERLETKSGVSTKGRSFRNDGIIAEVVRMARLLKLRGPANVQGFLLSDGSVQWIEINPRFSGTLALTIAAGVNAPLLLLRSALGLPVPPRLGAYREVTMMRYWEEVFVDPAGAALPSLSLQGGVAAS